MPGDMQGSQQLVRGECKMPGGKLVAVSVTISCEPASEVSAVRMVHCQIDGDFFLESVDRQEDLVEDLDQCIVSMTFPLEAPVVEGALARVLQEHKGVELIGASARTLTLALLRALEQADVPAGAIRAYGPLSPLAQGQQAPELYRDLDQEHRHVFQKRWRALPLQIVVDRPRQPAQEVALDAALAQAVCEGREPATLRIWNWASPAVVIGRFQSLSNEVHLQTAERLGFSVVRRVSGGGAMFARPEHVITYSLYTPAQFAQGLNHLWTYRLCDWWLIESLNHLGIEAGWSGMNDIASSQGKIGGAAERRFPGRAGEPGALLHHDMLSYDIDTDTMMQVLNVSQEKMADKAVRSARSRVAPLKGQTALSRSQLLTALLAYLPTLAPKAHLARLGEQVEQAGRQLAAERFSQVQWTADIV
ncbi:ligase [Bombiscardovia nodaiensis]|uniref:Ligase n=1 Tax=Bombiscardovia nodaiensis TaxID=2932181 RepID=A0ABM8B9D8_9BIFI|nr:ligase [Bombiscardovia nodaiensis]